jgi:hypothetical protein
MGRGAALKFTADRESLRSTKSSGCGASAAGNMGAAYAAYCWHQPAMSALVAACGMLRLEPLLSCCWTRLHRCIIEHHPERVKY